MNNNASAKSLIARIEMFIQEGNWENAKTYVEHVLDEEPENGYAYFLKMMVQRKAKTDEELVKIGRSVTSDENYPYIQLFGSSDLVDRVNHIEQQIIINQDVERKNGIYQQAMEYIKQNTSHSVTKAVECLRMIPGWKDADSQIPECLLKIKDLKYDDAVKLMKSDEFEDLVKAIACFEEIRNWKDSEAQIQRCKIKIHEKKDFLTTKAEEKIDSRRIKRIERGIDEIKDLQYTNNMLQLGEDDFDQYIEEGETSIQRIREKRKKIAKRLAEGLACICVVICGVLFAEYLKTNSEYKNAISLAENKQYVEAYELFSQKGFFKDSIDRKLQIQQKAFITQILNTNESSIPFGQYKGNDIEWIVLEVSDDEALLVSKNVLTNMIFNQSGENVPFEQSTLFKTLNENLYNEIFSEEEKEIILETILDAPETESGEKNDAETSEKKEEVKAKVFLLSSEELEQYFSSKKEYIAKNLAGKKSNYWLRTPGVVNKKGTVDTEDLLLNQRKGVRPAIWIDLSTLSEKE